MNPAPKEVVDALACDVDNLRAELSKMRTIHDEVKATQRELRPLREDAHKLRLLLGEVRQVMNSSALGVLTIDLADAVRRVRELESASEKHESQLTNIGSRLGVLNVVRAFDTLSGRVDALETERTERHTQEHPADTFATMDSKELIGEACTVLGAVLDTFDGPCSDEGLHDYGENRCKYLLAELQKRWEMQ